MHQKYLSLLVFVSIFIGDITLCEAAEFFRKQSGTTTIANGNNSVTVSLLDVDRSQSFLVFSSTLSDADPNDYQVGGEITNSTTLTFERTGTQGILSISWQVFEFEGGVNVQHGSELNVARNTNVDIPIECIDLTKTFAIATIRKSGSQLGSDDGVTANLVDENTLRLFVTGTAGANVEEVYWQVIEYNAAVVKKLTTTMTGTTATATITPAVSDLTKTFVIGNHGISGDLLCDDLPRTELTNSTTVTYTRNAAINDVNFLTYVVELTDNSTVARGTQSFANGFGTQNVTISAGASSGVIAPGQMGRQGSSTRNGTDDTGHAWFTYTITSGTNLQISRDASTQSANAPWQIVTFEDTDTQQNTFYSYATGDWEDNTTWSFTPDGSTGAVPTSVYPRSFNNVIIQDGHTITIDAVTDNSPCSESPDGLGLANVGPFTGSGDQMFYHTGDIIVGDGGALTSSEEVMFAGYTNIQNGGTITINEDFINLGYLEVNTTASLVITDDFILSGNSTTIIDNTTSGSDDTYMDHADATLCGEGTLSLGNGGADPQIQYLNGAGTDQVCSNLTVTCTSNCGGFTSGPPSGGAIAGYIGPGGVGNATYNKLWLRADDLDQADGSAVTSWADASGNGLTANSSGVSAEEPSFNLADINGLPSIGFDGGDFLNLGNVLNFTPGTDSWSFLIAYNVPGATPQGTFFSKATSATRQYQYTIDDNAGSSRFTSFIGGNSTIGSVAATNSWFISSHTNTATQKDSWTNETSNFSAAGIGTDTEPTADVLIGARRDTGPTTGTGFLLTGDIAEIAIYNKELNAAQRIITSNYLAAKYNVSLSANDVYTMDTGGNGDHDFGVAGIGQASDGSNHRDAQGSGLIKVRVWNSSDLDNGEFLMWGYDDMPTPIGSFDVDGTVIEERVAAIWKVSEFGGDVGSVSISFDFSSTGGNPLGSNLRLLIDRDDDFTTNDVNPIVGTVSGDIAVFSNINFQDGDRFTLGNTDASQTLPVELMEFTVASEGHSALLTWATASEINNDFFSIERSSNGTSWDEIGVVQGAGTTKTKSYYHFTDAQPLRGFSYYRLRQTDFDGEFSMSKSVSFYLKDEDLQVYPNPTSGTLSIFPSPTTSLMLTDLTGKAMDTSNYSYQNGMLQMNNLPAGVYFLQIDGRIPIRIIKQ